MIGHLCKIDRSLAAIKCDLDVLQILHVVGQDVRQRNLQLIHICFWNENIINVFNLNLPVLGEILDRFEQFCKPGISHLK